MRIACEGQEENRKQCAKSSGDTCRIPNGWKGARDDGEEGGDVTAHQALIELLKASPEWRRFFRQCCETSALRLRSQAWQFRDELLERRGERFSTEALEDALLTIARKVLPESPAAAWDGQWAAGLTRDALRRLNERQAELSTDELAAVDTSPEAEYLARMNAAAKANDPVAFRVALKGWERAGLEALEAARRVVA